VVLGAGASRRLGRAKQLVEYQGQTLIQRASQACVEAEVGDVFVLLGARAEEIREKALRSMIEKNRESAAFQVLENLGWSEGMSHTIAFAAKTILLPQQYQGVCFVLCDQIHFEAKLLKALIAKHQETGKSIVISQYDEGQGPPSFFHQSLFQELSELGGDDGAKVVVKKNKDQVAWIDFKLGGIDVDKAEDITW